MHPIRIKPNGVLYYIFVGNDYPMTVQVSSLPRPKELQFSLCSMVILPLEKLIVINTWDWLDLCCVSMFTSTCEILLRRLPGEKESILGFARFFVAALPILFYSLGWSPQLSCLLMYFSLFVGLIYIYYRRLMQLRPLFKQHAVKNNIEMSARFIIAILMGVLMQIYLFSVSRHFLCYLVLTLLLAEYIFLCIRAIQNRSMILSKSKEDFLNQLTYGELRPQVGQKMSTDISAMSALYQKVVYLFESNQPFLDPDYGLNDLSRDVFTNKTYLSKAINIVAGRNFRQFINYYRVKHSVKMINSNPHQKVEDISRASGFHSTVTFNMAFKVNVGETPGEYAQRVKSKLGRKILP